MKVYVARHGKTEWNAQNRICGRTDVELTEEGRRQAEELAESLTGRGVDVILASPMKRAIETARAVSRRCGAPVEVDKRLIEQDYGVYEGADRLDPGFWAVKRTFAVRYPGGESMMDVAGRVYPLLKELKDRYPGRTVLLVCHGGVCRVIRSYFEDMTNEEFPRWSVPNAAVAEYELQ